MCCITGSLPSLLLLLLLLSDLHHSHGDAAQLAQYLQGLVRSHSGHDCFYESDLFVHCCCAQPEDLSCWRWDGGYSFHACCNHLLDSCPSSSGVQAGVRGNQNSPEDERACWDEKGGLRTPEPAPDFWLPLPQEVCCVGKHGPEGLLDCWEATKG